MKLNKSLAFVLTLIVDFLALLLGAATISFLSVGGVLVFLIEFYCIKIIHRKVFEFLTNGSDSEDLKFQTKSYTESRNNPDETTLTEFADSTATAEAIDVKKEMVVSILTNKENLDEICSPKYLEQEEKRVAFRKPGKFLKIAIVILAGIAVIATVLLSDTKEKKYPGYLYPICENGLYGYVDSVGNRIIEPTYLYATTFWKDRALVVVDTIYKEVDDSISFYADVTDKVVKQRRLFIKYGFIDRSGKFALQPKYICFGVVQKDETLTDMEFCSNVIHQFTFRNGRAMVYDTLTWKEGFMDVDGNIVIPCEYLNAHPFSNGLAIAYKKNGKPLYSGAIPICPTSLRCAYINTDGDSITEFKFENLTPFMAKRGLGQITTFTDFSEGYWTNYMLINENGEYLDTLPMWDKYHGYSEDGICVTEQAMFFMMDSLPTPSWGFINNKGEQLKPLDGLNDAQLAALSKRNDIMYVYPEDVNKVDVTRFANGLAGVTPDHEHWFFIDRYMLIHGYGDESIYENIDGFYNGLCAVKKNGKWGFVNNRIKEVIPCEFDSCGIAYPYLEEAFELNPDGSVAKTMWINRSGDVVWEYGTAEKIDNKYCKKDKKLWGKWRSDVYSPAPKDYDKYLWSGVVALLAIVIVVFIATKKKPEEKAQAISFKRKYITSVVASLAVAAFLVSGHYLLNYLVGEYTGFLEPIFNTSSDNQGRKSILNKKYVRYEDERFMAADSIGVTPKNTKWLDGSVGTLPIGKYISTYVGTGKDRYYAGEQEVTRYRRKQVPRYKTINYGWGYKETYQDGWDWVKEPYIDHESVYYDYTWHYALSSFDISDQLSSSASEDSIYSWYLQRLAAQLTANFGHKYIYTSVNGKKALRYQTYDGTPLKRVIFCANGRAFVMETRSIDKLNEHSDEACKKIVVNGFFANENGNSLMANTIAGLIIGIIVLVGIFLWHNHGGKTLNTSASRFKYLSVLSAAINIAIACKLAHWMFVNFDYEKQSVATLEISLLSALIVSAPLTFFYSKKEKLPYHCDYIVPLWMDKLVYSKISNDAFRKIFLTLVAYPFMAISLLPFGIVAYLYSIPALAVSLLIAMLFRWVRWIAGDKLQLASYIPTGNPQQDGPNTKKTRTFDIFFLVVVVIISALVFISRCSDDFDYSGAEEYYSEMKASKKESSSDNIGRNPFEKSSWDSPLDEEDDDEDDEFDDDEYYY